MDAILLKSVMDEAHVTQTQLAKAVGIGRGTLNTKINGHRSFDTEEIIAICEYLNITDLSTRAQIFLS